MIEVICAGFLFLSTNACLDSKSVAHAAIDTTQPTLVQPNILVNDILAGNEYDSNYSSGLEELFHQFDIIIPNSQRENNDLDRDRRRQESEVEHTESDRSADERRQELGIEEHESDGSHKSDYRRQADEIRDGTQITVPGSESNSDRNADERRRELE